MTYEEKHKYAQELSDQIGQQFGRSVSSEEILLAFDRQCARKGEMQVLYIKAPEIHAMTAIADISRHAKYGNPHINTKQDKRKKRR